MEKLTFENISCYGEGLKFIAYGCIEEAKGYFNNAILVRHDFGINLDDCTLILRPMSDLTKPIIIEGKEVTPIVELAKIAFPEYKWEIKNYNYSTNVLQGKPIDFCVIGNGFIAFTTYAPCHIPNQLQLFQWLYKNKFDLHGLIEKNLAVDVNTLETNPYNT